MGARGVLTGRGGRRTTQRVVAKSKASPESDPIRVPLTALAPDPENPRKMTDEARAGLGVSMETFGELGMVFNDRKRILDLARHVVFVMLGENRRRHGAYAIRHRRDCASLRIRPYS